MWEWLFLPTNTPFETMAYIKPQSYDFPGSKCIFCCCLQNNCTKYSTLIILPSASLSSSTQVPGNKPAVTRALQSGATKWFMNVSCSFANWGFRLSIYGDIGIPNEASSSPWCIRDTYYLGKHFPVLRPPQIKATLLSRTLFKSSLNSLLRVPNTWVPF